MNIYKYLALFVTVLSAAILQPTFFNKKFFLPGATPDLVIVVVVCWALLKGPAIGAIAGFGAGFFYRCLTSRKSHHGYFFNNFNYYGIFNWHIRSKSK